jgi:hypothetical protein
MLTRRLLLPAAAAFLLASFALGQDSQSLGDLARQTRQRTQQIDAQAAAQSAAQPADAGAQTQAPHVITNHVITNDELPDHAELAVASLSGAHTPTAARETSSYTNSTSAEQWRSQIQAQKRSVASLERQINSANDENVPRNCRRGCGQWNARQQERQNQAQGLRAQLQEEQKRLDEMEDSARKQGFGSAVYDP